VTRPSGLHAGLCTSCCTHFSSNPFSRACRGTEEGEVACAGRIVRDRGSAPRAGMPRTPPHGCVPRAAGARRVAGPRCHWGCERAGRSRSRPVSGPRTRRGGSARYAHSRRARRASSRSRRCRAVAGTATDVCERHHASISEFGKLTSICAMTRCRTEAPWCTSSPPRATMPACRRPPSCTRYFEVRGGLRPDPRRARERVSDQAREEHRHAPPPAPPCSPAPFRRSRGRRTPNPTTSNRRQERASRSRSSTTPSRP
jgi:hypothetical protein